MRRKEKRRERERERKKKREQGKEKERKKKREIQTTPLWDNSFIRCFISLRLPSLLEGIKEEAGVGTGMIVGATESKERLGEGEGLGDFLTDFFGVSFPSQWLETFSWSAGLRLSKPKRVSLAEVVKECCDCLGELFR